MRQHVIAAAFPCNTFGSLYLQVDDADGHRHAIGCQDALRLGESAARPFEELPELRQPDYQVWRSLQQPGRFLVQPTAFRVARYAASHPTFAFRPVMMLYGTLTDTPGMDRYTLSATLIADVSPARLSLLRAALVAFSPAGVTPEIFWPTDPSVGAATAATWLVPGSAPPPQSLVVVDGVTVSFTTAGADALLLTAMIGHGGVTGALSFALSDGTRLDSALLLDGLTAGPPDTGPVTVTIAGATATLTNRTGQPMNVFGLALIGPGGAMPAAAGLTLAPGATADVPIPAGATTALADARPASAASIQELDIFVEDVTQTVQFINQIVFSNHAITTLRVAARIAGTTHEEASDLAEGAVITLSFTLPITAYLAPRGLEFAITRTDATGTHTTPWQSRDLTTGSVVGVTFDMT